jgi:hypothetical protein
MNSFEKLPLDAAEPIVTRNDLHVQAEGELSFWVLALTFAWALIPIFIPKVLPDYDQVVSTLATCVYPLACVFSARLLFKRKRMLKTLFAGINLACVLGWAVLMAWLTTRIALNPWH